MVKVDANSSDLSLGLKHAKLSAARMSTEIARDCKDRTEIVLEQAELTRALFARVKICKLKYLGHISCNASLEKNVTLDPVPGLGRKVEKCK